LPTRIRRRCVTVLTIIPGLVRTAMSESALSCAEPSIEQWFKGAFAKKENISPESVASLVSYIACGAADVLSGRYIFATDDVPQMVERARQSQEQDLYVLRERALQPQ
jgi:NADP-dependent 3-hydroxy acid dehydrogenase YdfG